MSRIAIGVFAHPDDAEIFCAGTLALLHGEGWEVDIATLTAGDCGSATLPREKISRIRRKEAEKAVSVLEGAYTCLECDDAFILYDRETILKGVKLLREVRPEIVFTASPSDYMLDHEMTSTVVRTACFICSMRNIETPGIDVHDRIPYLYYSDPMEGKTIFGEPVTASILVDISTVMPVKEEMLCCHASQRDWLREHHGMDEYIIAMKQFASSRGKEIHVPYAEGFRQHLGHGFPQDNILKSILGGRVHIP